MKRRVLQGIAAAVVASLTAVAVFVPGKGSASAATDASCGFASAGTGTYAQTLCWFDLSGYDAGAATSAAGQQLTVALPGGYTMNFTLNVSGSVVRPVAYPTYSAAYLGQNGHYAGVAGKPALYQSQSGPTTATLSNIGVTNPSGGTVTGYALVGADAESSDDNESITWTSSAPIQSLTQTPTDNGLGNACGGGFSGVGTTTVTCVGRSTGTKTGTAILAAENPSTFAQRMVGGGLQAVAFGVLISKVQLNKSVVGGFAGDSFGLTVKDSDGSTIGHADTGGGASASTGPITVLTGTNGADFGLAETATAGTLTNYTQSWACTRNGTADPSVPPTSGAAAGVHLGIGDFENCTITNTARPAAITLTKAAQPVDTNHDGLTDAGDDINYTFTVTNAGELALHGVTVHDAKVGPVTCAATTLAPGQSTTCTAAPYRITADDQAAGAVDNTATATGVPDGATATVTSPPATAHVPVTAPAPAITLTKSADPTTVQAAGDPVTYSFAVGNSGNVALTGVMVNETAFSGTGTPPAISCPATTLAPGASMTCTAGPYAVSQADVDAGTITNTAVATGTPPNGPAVTSPPSSAKVTAAPTPAITLAKSADPTTVHAAGDPVTYTLTVGNSGNVTLFDVVVGDTAFSGTGNPPTITCPTTTLAPATSMTCTAGPYAVSQADVDAGTITNTAVASGTPPHGTAVTSPPATAVVTAPAAPAITLVKTPAPATVHAAGDSVTYTFTATNAGNVTLSQVTVAETSFSGTGPAPVVSCPAATLAPGASTTCTATYTVTQADVDAGTITNTAVATGTPPSGAPVSDTAGATVTAPAAPALALVKSASPSDKATFTVGRRITYSFAVTNTGNVTLTGVRVDETAFTGHGRMSPISCPVTTLAPGASTTCTAIYTVTQADVDTGSVKNTATATGTPPTGPPTVSPPSSVVVPGNPHPALTLVKKASPAVVTAVGQTVHYTFRVTNSGNVTVHGVRIAEGTFTGHSTLSAINCPVTTLAPTAATTCTATYRIVRDDLRAKTLRNTATATGTTPGGGPVASGPSTATVRVRVSAPPVLAGTGNDTARQLLIGLLLVLGGTAVLLVARRRSR